MSRRGRPIAPKGKAPEMDWEATDDPDCVAEDGWQDEEETLWNCTMCKRYVKMKHLVKLWPRSQAIKSGPRREGLASNCLSEHFKHRYHEVTIAVGIRNSRPEIMLYSNMAMVWAEIVLHKDVDWRTVAGRNVNVLDRSQHFIPTSWDEPSDCWPRWSNRRSTDNLDSQQRHRTPPRRHEGHDYNEYNYGNDTTPISFGGGSGGSYSGAHQIGTTINTRESYTPPHPRDTYGNRGLYDRRTNTPESYMPANARDTYELRGQYGRTSNSPENRMPPHASDTYESYRNSPEKESEHHTTQYTDEGYGRRTYGSDNTPPPSFRTREDEDAEFQRQMREATIQSQHEYIRKLEDDYNFMERQYNDLYHVYPSGQYSGEAGPSRRRDDSDSDED